MLNKSLLGLGALAAVMLAAAPASAQQPPIKIGLIMPYSGQFADTATQMDNGIKLYVKQHGDTVAGKKIEIIRKDTGGIAPDVAKRLAQELVVRDKVDILAGFVLTPKALAAGDVSAEAKKFMVVMNAATSIITTKSPYMVRTSLTHAADRPRRSAPGPSPRAASRRPTPWSPTTARATTPRAASSAASRRPAARSSARCASRSPIRTSPPSCSAPRTSIRKRSSSSSPAARSRPRIGKALAERGIDPAKTKILGMGELTEDEALQEHGRRRARHHHRLALRPRATTPR